MNYPNHYSYTRKLNSKLTTRGGVYKIYMDIKYEDITVHIHTCVYVFVYIQCINVYISLYIKNSKKKLFLIFGPLNIPSPS